MLPKLSQVIGTVVLAGAAIAPAIADEFPNRPITMILPMSAGGGGDTLARTLAEDMAEQLGQPIVVDNRPGATGIIGVGHAAKQAPDGYSVLVTSTTFQIHNDLLRDDLQFDAVKDFDPVSMLGEGVFTFVVPADSPYDSLAEFLEGAGNAEQSLTYGTWGHLSAGHILGEQFSTLSDKPLLHVPYKGEVNMITDLVNGNLQSGWLTQLTAKTMMDAGRIKVLGSTGLERNVVLPQVPTFAEQGIEGFEMTGWIGLYVPAGTPAEVTAKLSEAAQAAMATPKVAERAEGLGLSIVASSPEEFAQRFAHDYQNWQNIVSNVNLD